MQQADIEVRLYYKCNSHALIYDRWAWKCVDGDVVQRSAGGFCGGTSSYPADSSRMHHDEVDYDMLDPEDEVATRNIFTWLRSEGYPESEKSISLHEWLEPYESDDDGELEDLESNTEDDQLDTKVAAWFDRAIPMPPSSPAARTNLASETA